MNSLHLKLSATPIAIQFFPALFSDVLECVDIYIYPLSFLFCFNSLDGSTFFFVLVSKKTRRWETKKDSDILAGNCSCQSGEVSQCINIRTRSENGSKSTRIAPYLAQRRPHHTKRGAAYNNNAAHLPTAAAANPPGPLGTGVTALGAWPVTVEVF